MFVDLLRMAFIPQAKDLWVFSHKLYKKI